MSSLYKLSPKVNFDLIHQIQTNNFIKSRVCCICHNDFTSNKRKTKCKLIFECTNILIETKINEYLIKMNEYYKQKIDELTEEVNHLKNVIGVHTESNYEIPSSDSKDEIKHFNYKVIDGYICGLCLNSVEEEQYNIEIPNFYKVLINDKEDYIALIEKAKIEL